MSAQASFEHCCRRGIRVQQTHFVSDLVYNISKDDREKSMKLISKKKKRKTTSMSSVQESISICQYNLMATAYICISHKEDATVTLRFT